MSGSIGGVDASIALQAGRGVQQGNPLQQVGDFVHTMQGINQLKLAPGQQQLQRQEIQRGAVGNAKMINQAAYGSVAHLLSTPEGGITHSALTDALASTEANLGIPTNGVIADILRTAPGGDGPEFDRYIRSQIASRTQPAERAVGAIAPTQGTMNLGSEVIPTLTPAPGQVGQGTITQAGPGFRPGLSPEAQVAQVPRTITDPAEAARLNVPVGTVITETAGQRLQQQGAGSNLAPGRTPVVGSPFPNGGRLAPPPALMNPNRQPTAPGAPAGGAPAPGVAPTTATPVVTQLSPAQQTEQSNRGSQSAAGFTGVTEAGNRAGQQQAILGNMANDLAQFSSGTGAGKTLDFQRALVSWAPGIAKSLGVDPKVVAANESFNKLAAQIADAQGAGSDARLAVNQEANPTAHLSPEGADLIIRQLRGNADYLQARQQLADKYADKSDYNGFSAGVTRDLDPRAFQFQRMSPEQRRTYFESIKDKGEREAFKRGYMKARDMGLIAQ